MGSVEGCEVEQKVAISSKGKRDRNARLTFINWQISYYLIGEMELSSYTTMISYSRLE